jgi:hypothetical protein
MNDGHVLEFSGGIKLDLAVIAYHEAGHAVHGRSLGWWLSDGGVEIYPAHVTHTRTAPGRTDDHKLCINALVGRVAERRYLGLPLAYAELEVHDFLYDLDAHIDAVREAEDEGTGDGILGDVCATLKMIRDVHPGMSDDDVIDHFMHFEEEAIEAVEELWPDIEKIAKALLAKIPPDLAGAVKSLAPLPDCRVWLSDEEVEELIGPGTGHGNHPLA